MKSKAYILFLSAIFALNSTAIASSVYFQEQDSVKKDTLAPYEPSKAPTFQPAYRFGDPFSNRISRSPLFLRDPSQLDMQVQFNPDTASDERGVTYSVYENIGNLDFRPASFMTFEEYNRYNNTQLNREYFKERSAGLDGESAVSGRSLIPRLYISPALDRIFGGSYVDIQPNGFVTLDFGGRFQRNLDPELTLRQQKNGSFAFDQQISMSIVGKVGEKLAVTANFDNNNTFDFQNNLKVEYTGYDEDIIKRIEIGNVSMPVSNSLMSGAQSLFGLKAELQFGKLFVTSVLSQQRGRSETLNIESGFQGREFEMQASDYDENRHFFLGHFFRDNYEDWLRTLPNIRSGVNITRVEVYALNRNNDTETTRNIVALMDMGEGTNIFSEDVGPIGQAPRDNPTRNGANDLFGQLNVYDVESVDSDLEGKFPNFDGSRDYVKITTARKLNDSEYDINTQLGYITLLRRLQSDEVLAVSYEYTYDGERYKVGELTEDYQGRSDSEVIYLKMLRPNKINVQVPTWDLMMKNIYNLNASQVGREGFQLKVHYRDDATGIDNPSLHEGATLKDKPLIEVLGLDRLNQNNDLQPDQNFDFVEGVTIDVKNGNIIFPVLEPFGRTLESNFNSGTEGDLIEKYVYDELYENTKAEAELNASKNKFVIIGKLTAGSASEIRLPGINIAEGSVVVTAGGTLLAEGVDYSVDYNLGVVRILNDGILNSGKSLNVSYEKADLFNFQTRTLSGTRFDYRFNENFNIGATLLHLNERPGGISRYAVGTEPTSNTKYGVDINYQAESRLITKIVDAIPLVSTKAPSRITFNAEFAQLIPGTSNIVNGEGTSYMDDFENAITPINIGGWQSWKLAATPTEDPNDLNSGTTRGIEYNDKKAKIAWYTVDNSIFYRSTGNTRPDNISDTDLENHYERPIPPQEIFRQRDRTLVNINEPIFDIAYFPTERGQYNYNENFDAESADRSLVKDRWGGITRPITNEVNFNKTNVEYLEFWLMDPFIDGERGVVKDGNVNRNVRSSGELVFNLGSVSEDLSPDDKHAFENGLPIDGQPVTDDEVTPWGRITTEQYLTNFFENTAGARENQDVGLDGLRGEDEARILDLNGVPRTSVFDGDVSADDFKYVLDASYDAANATIVERYKNWNGLENNSPINTEGTFIPASTNIPDNEDINNDKTIQDIEEYFEYRIPLTYAPNTNGGNLALDEDYVVDQITSEDGEATWYLYRIPIKNNPITRGSPTFETIKYIRMYLTDWEQPVVLRMAKMQLVGSQWRKFEQALNEPGLNELPNSQTSDFSVSVVSVEENSTPTTGGSPYVLPPGLDRDIDNTTTQNRRINEQSLQVCVEDLNDKDGRAVYKNVSFDLINYGRLKMFFHAEVFKEDFVLDDEVTAFLRLGTDFSENYYEIEVPLKITPSDVGGSAQDIQRLVWPLENELDVSIKELLGIKSERNRMNSNELSPYTVPSNDGKYNFTVKGRPDISSIQVLMIGVRNPGDESSSPKSVCIWANELRLTDFDSNAGWAANARLSTQLADLGTISASTRYTSIGFGGIQQRISERARAETKQYDVSANLNLEKFMFPEKTGLTVPMFVSYEKSTIIPQFDPLDPDIPLEASLETIDTEEEREEYRRIVEDRSTSRSINFTNVRKNKVNPEAKSRVFDIENFTFSYAYSDRSTSNYSTQQLLDKRTSGGISYNYAPIPLTIEPFKEVEKLSSPYFALLKDANISLLPSNFSFSGNLNRTFRLTQYYNNDLTIDGIDPQFEKLFTFARNYSLRWDLTRSLGLTYSATANAVIDEKNGEVTGDIDTQQERQYIWNQVTELGRMKNFNQSIAANYKVPLDKLPFTDWLSSDIRYSIGYNWIAGPVIQIPEGELSAEDEEQNLDFGNFISNQRDRAVNARVDMTKLYNKVTFLKNAGTPSKPDDPVSIGKGALQFLMMLKSVNGSYKINEGTSLPGFAPSPFLFGLDSGFNQPGVDFILGSQNPNIRTKAAEKGWLVENEDLNAPFEQSYNTDLDIQADIEPFKEVRVQLTWSRGLTNRYQETFRYDLDKEGGAGFDTFTPARSGSYTTSFLSIQSAFEGSGENFSSDAFTQFENNLLEIRERLNRLNQVTDQNGLVLYDTLSQDVLVPAFIAAYSGQSADNVALSPFPKIPLPNWRVDYAGLSKIPAIAEIFSSFTISHGYTSTYSVSNFTNSLIYGQEDIGLQNSLLDYPLAEDDEGRLVPVYIVNQVMISEQFVPLIGVNIRTVSNISTRAEFRKSRILSLSLSNSQVQETTNNDVTIDFGYTKTGFKLPWKFQGRTISLENDVTFRVAGSVRDSKTIQRKIFDTDNITDGNRTFQLRPQMSYKINSQLDLTAYFERNVTKPKGRGFRRNTTAFGIQLRFGLAQ